MALFIVEMKLAPKQKKKKHMQNDKTRCKEKELQDCERNRLLEARRGIKKSSKIR
jgi:hypothetical protein